MCQSSGWFLLRRLNLNLNQILWACLSILVLSYQVIYLYVFINSSWKIIVLLLIATMNLKTWKNAPVVWFQWVAFRVSLAERLEVYGSHCPNSITVEKINLSATTAEHIYSSVYCRDPHIAEGIGWYGTSQLLEQLF